MGKRATKRRRKTWEYKCERAYINHLARRGLEDAYEGEAYCNKYLTAPIGWAYELSVNGLVIPGRIYGRGLVKSLLLVGKAALAGKRRRNAALIRADQQGPLEDLPRIEIRPTQVNRYGGGLPARPLTRLERILQKLKGERENAPSPRE